MSERISIPLPEALREDLAGCELERTSLGETAATYRVTGRNHPTS
jgi:hypothetical protein